MRFTLTYTKSLMQPMVWARVCMRVCVCEKWTHKQFHSSHLHFINLTLITKCNILIIFHKIISFSIYGRFISISISYTIVTDVVVVVFFHLRFWVNIIQYVFLIAHYVCDWIELEEEAIKTCLSNKHRHTHTNEVNNLK